MDEEKRVSASARRNAPARYGRTVDSECPDRVGGSSVWLHPDAGTV
jgi:hypothetical protein